jgi:hypothetical protein
MVAKNAVQRLPDVFLSTTETSAAVARMVSRGEVRKIGPRLYTPNPSDTAETIIGRNLWPVIGLLFPQAIVSHRTALTQKPTPGGTVFLTLPMSVRFGCRAQRSGCWSHARPG